MNREVAFHHLVSRICFRRSRTPAFVLPRKSDG